MTGMWFQTSDLFRIPGPEEIPEDEPLIVHQHDDGTDTSLVIFVHGLGGLRYGTWGQFPQFLFEDLNGLGAAIGLYSYRTQFGRLRFTASIDLEREATVLADVVRDLPARYRRVVLLAHSMGGLLAKAAVKSLVDRAETVALARMSGIILMATPQAGSLRIPSLLQLFSYDARALAPHGAFVTRIEETFVNRVSQTPVRLDSDKFFLPVWAVIAPADQWVDRLSAGLNLPSSRRKEIRGSHTSIVKPKHRDADGYTFVKKALSECLTEEAQPAAPNEAVTTPTHPALAVISATDALQTQRAIQLTQMTVTLPIQSDFAPQVASQFAGLGIQCPLGSGQSRAEFMQQVQPKPRLDELFEVITNQDEVPRAVYQMGQSSGLIPYQVDYINGRQGVPDVQATLETALREARGRLLICGPRGIGKTRELAELARAACGIKWKVLVALYKGDGRLGPLCEFPSELNDAKVLIVIDNLQTRIAASFDEQAAPYLERLELLVGWLDRRLPGSVRVIATMRDELRFQPYLGFGRNDLQWRRFGLFHLPGFTDEGLQKMLTSIALQADVMLAPEDVPRLIENSDRKPETVFINVELARQRQTGLTVKIWRPTEGESWQQRLTSARAEHAGVDGVCQALILLANAGLPVRVSYLAAVARARGVENPQIIIDELVDAGLLRKRQDLLTAFNVEQLKELIQPNAPLAHTLFEYWEAIEQAITTSDARSMEWADDLIALALSLERARETDRAEQVVAKAIKLNAGGARPYQIRAAIRFGREDLLGAEADLTEALATGVEEENTRWMRASIRILLCHFTEGLEDLKVALEHGRDDSVIHALRGTAYFQLGRWQDTESALSAAVEHGESSGGIFYVRGVARLQLKNAAGAEEDFSFALGKGFQLSASLEELSNADRGVGAALGGPAAVHPLGNGIVHTMRAIARMALNKSAEAEEDLTAAITAGFGDQFQTFKASMKASPIPMMARASEQLNEVPGFGSATLFHMRGLARLDSGDLPGAEDDFNAALAGAFMHPEVYLGRGWARFRAERFIESEQDATTAIEGGMEDSRTYFLRGRARLAKQSFVEAEQDFDKSIALDGSLAEVFTWRAIARMNQQKLTEAENDLDIALEKHVDARTLFLRGCLRLDLGKNPEAEQDFTAAQSGGFEEVALFLSRGLARLKQDKLAEAEQDVDTAFAKGAGDVQAYSTRAAIRIGLERYADAESDLDAAFALGRTDPWVCFHRGLARQASGRYAEAEGDYDAVIAVGALDGALGFTQPDALARRGFVRLAQGKAMEAGEDYTAAIRGGRDDAGVRSQLALAYQEQKRYREAEAELDRVLATDRRSMFWESRGQLRDIRGNFPAAESDLDEAIRLDPSSADAFYSRGVARYGQGKIADAALDHDAAIVLSPANAAFLGSRIFVRIQSGQIENAAEDYTQLKEMGVGEAEIVGYAGVLQLAGGDAESAIGQLTVAAALDSSWHYWRGLALLMTGRLDGVHDAYMQGVAAGVPGDVVLALGELNYYVRRHPHRFASPAAQSLLGFIRSELRRMAAKDA